MTYKILYRILLFSFLFFGFINANSNPKTAVNVEICDNGIDDDNDGWIDLNDPDCDCQTVEYQSIIPNPSFESHSCCPWDAAQMTCVDSWVQASAGTTDYMNTCRWIDAYFLPPPLPLPDGNGCVRFINGNIFIGEVEKGYKEYAGVCLNQPMKKDSTYLLEFYVGFIENSADINISIFGSSNCNNLPFSQKGSYDCPSQYLDWSLLKSKKVVSRTGEYWEKVYLEIIPNMDIAAIVVGPDCSPVESRQVYFYFLDNFILNEKTAFDFQPIELLSLCSPDFIFSVAENPDFLYQWYKNGIAIVGETSATLSEMRGEGDYQLRIISSLGCRIAEYVYEIPVYRDTISATICSNEFFLLGNQQLTESGRYIDTFITSEGCDSIVIVDLEVQETSFQTVQKQILKGEELIFNGNSYHSEGDFLVLLQSYYGCDSLVQLQLELTNIYIPNAFSPNADGINDDFQIFGAADEIANVHISIYDRWGTLLFKGEKWDGTSNGKALQTGVFVYLIRVTTTLGKELVYSGSVTLMQ